LAFAAEIYPEAPSLPGWRALDRRRRRGDDGFGRGLAAGRRLVDDLADRLRWRRWRWSGV
ncbi:MAG TPA: hypothetical protein VIJ47_09700, partial [Acidimicrobiales bacterium]